MSDIGASAGFVSANATLFRNCSAQYEPGMSRTPRSARIDYTLVVRLNERLLERVTV